MEDKGMAYDSRTLNNAKTIAAAQPNYLEQLAQEMLRQREFINILDERLGVVSERNPQEPTDEPTDRVHVSTMVSIMRRNNRDLERLIDELAI